MQLWVDTLSFKFIFYAIWHRKDLKEAKVLNYFISHKLAEKFFTLVFKKIQIQKISNVDSKGDYLFLKILDEKSRYLYPGIEEEADKLSYAILDQLFSEFLFSKDLFPCSMPKSWIERYFWFQIYDWAVNRSFIISVFKFSSGPQDRLFLKGGLFAKHLKDHRYYLNDRTILFKDDNGYGYIDTVKNIFRYFALIVLNVKKKNNPSNHLVGLQYCWGDNTEKRSDVYWQKDSGIENKDILFYFNRPDLRLTKDIEERFKKKQLSYVVPKRNFLIQIFKSSPASWFPDYRYSIDLIKGLKHCLNVWKFQTPGRFILNTILNLNESVFYWKHFFKDHGIKLHMCHSGDRGIVHVTNSMALELASGINVRSTYSYRSYDFDSFSREFHLFLLWGPQPGATQLSSKTYSLFEAKVGYLFDSFLTKNSDSRGDKFKICLFDTTSNSAEYEKFYSSFFSLIKRFNKIELVIKPKKLSKEELIRLFPKIEVEMAEGRVVFLNQKDDPQVSSKDADLIACLTVNSAGIEAALTKKKVVYWIPDKMENQQMGRSSSRICYFSLEEMLSDIAQILDGKEINIGDHSEIIDQIDPFRDGKAYLRTGRIFKHYLSHLDLGVKESLNLTISEYAKKWGEANVSRNDLDR
ncbi:MAG: hypothetical protein AB7I27_06205 [Bacteriovoracaceae bacterium]